MIRKIREEYGLDSPEVLSIMLQIPREKFAPTRYQDRAYDDNPISIGFGQTMSQPYTVAFMTDLLLKGIEVVGPPSHRATEGKKVLEIGTGSGYQAAVLSHLFKEVYTIEIVPDLARRARSILVRMGYKNVHVKVGSGEWGLSKVAPFDAIIITAAIEKEIPKTLFDQLKEGGVLVAPIGPRWSQDMTRFTKIKKRGKEKIEKKEFQKFVFVPFVEEKNGKIGI